MLARVISPLVARFGSATTLTVHARGKAQTLPVRVLRVDGHRYLVAIRGESAWVRDLRAAGSCELCHRGWVQRFAVVEVPTNERAPLIVEYCTRWHRRAGRLPDPAQHPVFELRSP